jgi:Icc protein
MRAVLGEIEEFPLVDLSDHWSLGLLNSQRIGHDAGYVTDSTLDRLWTDLDRIDGHVVLCLHHPPLSPCTEPDCGLSDSDRLLRVLRGSAVRVVLSGHVHQAFDTACDGIRFLGAPSTFRQLRHGGDPHYSDTGERPAARLLELHDDGGVEHRAIVAGDERRSIAP